MTTLEMAFGDKAKKENTAQSSARAEILEGAQLVRQFEISPDEFMSSCFAKTKPLSPENRAFYLQPLIHVIDGFFRSGILAQPKTMAMMEAIRHEADDITLMDMNSQNILRGWTVRREDHRPKAHTPQ